MSTAQLTKTNAADPLRGLKNEAKRLYVDATYSGRGHLESCARAGWDDGVWHVDVRCYPAGKQPA